MAPTREKKGSADFIKSLQSNIDRCLCFKWKQMTSLYGYYNQQKKNLTWRRKILDADLFERDLKEGCQKCQQLTVVYTHRHCMW